MIDVPEGKINNTGLSTLEMEIAKAFPVSWEFAFCGLFMNLVSH